MSPTARESPSRLAAAVAGLQAGMVATLAMLLWLGASAVWQRRSFWTSANLLATLFYGGKAVHSGFSVSTVSGLALYLLLYSTLGCVFAGIAGKRALSPRLVLAGAAAGVGWYYVSFWLLWKGLSPLIPMLHAAIPTLLGHVIYGAGIGRFPRFLGPEAAAPTVQVPEPASASREGV
jgi:hypothetical protein